MEPDGASPIVFLSLFQGANKTGQGTEPGERAKPSILLGSMYGLSA
jgi:hypothetical protein